MVKTINLQYSQAKINMQVKAFAVNKELAPAGFELAYYICYY